MTENYKMYVYGSCHITEDMKSDALTGIGGYGIVITMNGKQIQPISGGYRATTNARMDIMGITEGLKAIEKPGDITVYLSNGYIIDALNKGWLESWEKKGYKKKKHADLWRELRKILQQSAHAIKFEHSKTVRFSKEFQLAEGLAKNMSGKKNLPIDIKPESNGLFELQDAPNIEKLEIEDDKPDLDSICVDASTIGNPGVTEYRGVDSKTRQVLFQYKYPEATNNIGEFLAIVHALALYKKKGEPLKIIYSDSFNAISWVRQKKCKTKYKKTDNNVKLFDDIQRAVTWLEQNEYDTKVLKWNTGAWGQIPADYGRK